MYVLEVVAENFSIKNEVMKIEKESKVRYFY